MTRRRLSFTTRYVLFVGVLLFVANMVLGAVILNQSKEAMQSLVSKDMLDIVNSAAASLDGDALGALTADDVDGPVFRDIKSKLLVFQNSVDIEFIYAVKRVGADAYVFTVDPDPVDPGDFGESVLTTPALMAASEGTPTVDESPAEDRWGNFYSAFSPVYDSAGNVAGIVGVDFNSTWYDNEIRRNTVSIALVTASSVLLGGLVCALITRRVQRKFQELGAGLTQLSENVDQLMDEMAAYSGVRVTELRPDKVDAPGADDELGILEDKIHTMQHEMGLYLDYLHTQAYIDSLTRVGNSTAYHEAVNNIDARIDAGTADFWVIVFDMNGLKELNDTYGHECGDVYIKGAAHAISQGFAGTKVFRIGGDEFAIIVERTSTDEVDTGLARIADAVEAFNASTDHPAALALSLGASPFTPDADTCFKDVFQRADQIMYDNKRVYYRERGLRGRN